MMQSFLNVNKSRHHRQPSKHELNSSIYSIDSDRHRYRTTNPANTNGHSKHQDIIINSISNNNNNNRNFKNFNNRNKINDTGRLDLSFTKCNFPNDYLPYVTSSSSGVGAGTADIGKNQHLTSDNDRSSSYDDDEEDEEDDQDEDEDNDDDTEFGFSNQHLPTVQRTQRSAQYLVTSQYQTHQSESLPPLPLPPPPPTLSPLTPKKKHRPHRSNQVHQSTSSLFTTPLSWYNSLERSGKSLLSPTLAHFYHNTAAGSRASTGSTLPLPASLSYNPQCGSSDSSTSSSCMTSSNANFYNPHHHHHHQHRFHRPRGTGQRLARSCGCCLLTLLASLTIITLSVVVGFSLYLAIVTNFLTKTPLVYSIAGNFKVVAGDTFNMRLLNHSSPDYIRKSNRYESILKHILANSLMSNSMVRSEIYSFRMEDSLVVFFRLYASKERLDQQLDIQPKTVINFNRVENIFVEEKVLARRVRDLLADAFRGSATFLNQAHADIVIDSESVKISNIDQQLSDEEQLSLTATNNNNSHNDGYKANKSYHHQQHKKPSSNADLQPHHTNDIHNATNGNKPSETTTTTTTTATLSNYSVTNLTEPIHPYLNWQNVSTTISPSISTSFSSTPLPPPPPFPTTTETLQSENVTQVLRFETPTTKTNNHYKAIEDANLNANINNQQSESDDDGNKNVSNNQQSNQQQTKSNQTEHKTNNTNNGFNSMTIDSNNDSQISDLNLDGAMIQPNQTNQINTTKLNSNSISSTSTSTSTSSSHHKPNLIPNVSANKTQLPNIEPNQSISAKPLPPPPTIDRDELSKFSLPFGIGLRDIAKFVVNKLNSQNSGPSTSKPDLTIDDEGFVSVESRDGDVIFENNTEVDIPNVSNFTKPNSNHTNLQTNTEILTTTSSVMLHIENEPNIDGFVIPERTIENSDPTLEPNQLKPNEFDVLNHPTNRTLVASEDSFDLYSIRNSNSNSNIYTEEDITNVPTTEVPDSTTRTTNYNQNEFSLFNYPGNNQNLPDNEFNLYSRPPDGTTGNKFDRRISKKINTNQNNANSLKHHLNEIKKIKENNNDNVNYYIEIDRQPELSDNKLVKVDQVETTTATVPTTTITTELYEFGDKIADFTTTATTEPEVDSNNNFINNSSLLVNSTTLAPAAAVCDVGEFRCLKSAECIQLDDICNRIIDCADKSDEFSCRCVDYLVKDGKHQHKICDGIIDCADSSDESTCPQCPEGTFVCNGHQNQCIEMSKVCDGENDCTNGDDEQSCIALVDGDSSLPPSPLQNHQNQSGFANQIGSYYNARGILYIQHHGQWSPLCFDHYNLDINEVQRSSLSSNQSENASSSSSSSPMLRIDDMGQAVCKANFYSQLKSIDIVPMTKHHNSLQFSTISSNLDNNLKPTLSLWSSLFEPSKCPGQKVAQIECSSLECGLRPVSSKLRRRIIGGKSSSFGSWPWQVALYREGEFQCGAVVINSQWLLTAAHCFYSSPNAYWTARSGVLRRGGLFRGFREEIRRIEHIVIHPDYVDKGFLNDIALLKLATPLQFSKFIRPICLPGDDDDASKWHNQLCTTVGWGKLYEHGRIFPDTLQEVKLPILSTEECRKRTLFLPLYKITDNMFCAGFERGGRDACLGDSGGPMMCQKSNGKWILLGITSNGDGCGRAGKPGVYTKVYSYLHWISNITKTIWPIRSEPKCLGHRCSLGKCLEPSKVCDNIIDCENSSDELNCPDNSDNDKNPNYENKLQILN